MCDGELLGIRHDKSANRRRKVGARCVHHLLVFDTMKNIWRKSYEIDLMSTRKIIENSIECANKNN